LVRARTDAEIVACDISGALVEVAKLRLAEHKQVRFVVSDAQAAAAAEGPFDLFYSRHGVMFFPDPTTAFAQFRGASTGGARLVFSCFRSWEENPWASELACAAANGRVPAPGREPSGFAFAEPGYVGDILSGAGWSEVRNAALDFTYVAGSGPAAVEQALSFLTEIGPAAAVVRELDEPRRPVARDRMRKVLADHVVEDRVEFPAAAWIWTATAA
jgi:SAM-dependent methyltransferase